MTEFFLVDTLVASASLRTNVVDATSSSEYQEILEGLQRELKYKAYYRGANAIIRFSIQLMPLALPTHYRIMAMGSAIKSQIPPQQGTPRT